MIAVRIPEEIRKYKEKIMFGLNARQLISTLLALIVCVPLYYYGRNYMTDDTLSWIIIGIALPLVAIGFFRFNGMPMEKFAVAVVVYEVINPIKRIYKTENAFRTWQNMAIAEEAPKSGREKKRLKKYNQAASIERSVLMEEAEERGETDFDMMNAELLTVGLT